MIKGQKVKTFVQTSKFDAEEKEGIVKDIIKSKIGKDLIVVEVEQKSVSHEYKIHYRFENELKIV
jgi:hypothetical protein